MAALDVVLELVGLCGEDVGLLVRTVVGAVELHSAPVLNQNRIRNTFGTTFFKSTQKWRGRGPSLQGLGKLKHFI